MLFASNLSAATFTWTRLVGGNGSGSWTNQANWSGATLPTTNSDAANFNSLDLTADSTVTLDGSQTVNALNFADTAPATVGSWIINSGSPSTSKLTLDGAGPVIYVTSIGSGDAAVINAVIGGTNGFTKTGTSFLQLNGANNYSGGTTLSGSDCRFSFGHNNAFGTGTIFLGDAPSAGQIWFNAAGARTVTNAFEIRTIRWIIDGNTVNGVAAGDLTINGNVLLNTGPSGVRDIYPNGKNLTINGNVSVTPASNPMNKNGGSTLTLNGSNYVGGASSVAAGALIVNGPMNGGSTFTVAGGATLRGTGVFSGTISVASGGLVRPQADGSGTLTCGGFTMASGASLTLGFAAPNATTNGRVVVNGSLTLAGTINFSDLGGYTSGTYTAFTYTGTFVNNGVSLLGAPSGQTVVLDASVPNQILIRTLNGQLYPVANDSVPMSLASPLALSWIEVAGATNYDIYLGTVSNSVFSATTSTAGIFLGRTNVLTFNLTNLQPNTTYFWRVDGVATDGTITKGAVLSFTTGAAMNELMQDTWVATDALNRTLPGYAECGPLRSDRPIGIFYFLWHGTNSLGTDGPRDNTKVINAFGGYTDKLNPWADNPGWMSGSSGRSWYWGEPENGYYSNDDEWVIRRHIALLEAAGVDVLGFDTTNGNPAGHAPKYLKIMAVIRKMQMEGTPVRLKIFHYTHGGTGGSPATMTWLYDNFYKPGLYRDLWFSWQGKPLIIGYADGLSGDGSTPVSTEVRNFFTIKTGWANGSSGTNDWQWIDTPTRQNFGYGPRTDIAEQLPVTCGGWANGNLGRSYQNGVQPGFDNFHLTTNRTEGLGWQFSEQSFQGQKVDPQFLWITGWNEWWAGSWDAPTTCYTHLLTMCTSPPNRYFVDNYNAEYSRDIEPMKGGFTDNYYYQMVGNNRQRKGARPVPIASVPKTINLAGDFSDWSEVGPDFRDYAGDTLARNWPTTFGNLANLTDNTGRNDFTLLKVARDANNIYFYAQCASNLTSYTGSNWMNLFINLDRSRSTGWEGYDFAVNLGARTVSTTTLSQNTGTNWNWTTVRSDIAYKISGNQLMLAVPRASLGLTNDPVTFDFHWADNFQTNDISGIFLYGDSAPDRRFNYRYQAAAVVTNVLITDSFDAGKQSIWGASLTNGSKWNTNSSGSYSGSCVVACTTNGTSQSMLATTNIDTSKLESFRVSFRFKLANVLDAQNLNLEFNTNGGWVTVRDLGRDQYYSSGQAWSYDERQNVWMLCVEARNRSGTNAQFFTANFAARINASGLTTSTQVASIDDFQITGVTAWSNTAPVIAAVSNRTVIAGTTIMITNVVIDPDLPGQTMTWNLLAAPAGATLNSSNGIFNWRPAIAQSPTTNVISLKVADSGSPSLSGTNNFNIIVLRPATPGFGALGYTNRQFNFTIIGDPGPDYAVFGSTNLVNWLLLQQFNSPVPPIPFVDVSGTNFNQRFYKIQLSP